MKRAMHFVCWASMMFAGAAFAGPEDMLVNAWEGTCHQTMTTNHFELAPGESVEIDLDLTGCSDGQLGNLLYFGYRTTNNSSKPLSSRDKIKLTLLDESDNVSLTSTSGSILTDVERPTTCRLLAKNMNSRKTLKIRLRSSILIQQ